MSADRVAFVLAVLAAAGTAAFALTRTTCPWCRNRYSNWRAVQRHIKQFHHT